MNFETAEQIRAEYAEGHITQLQLAIKYGVSQSDISKIIRHLIYRGADKAPVKPLKERKLLAAGLVQLSVWVEPGDVQAVQALDKQDMVLMSRKERHDKWAREARRLIT